MCNKSFYVYLSPKPPRQRISKHLNTKRSKHEMINNAFNYKKAISLLILGSVFSQSFAQYEIKKYTINSGGSTQNEGQYEMTSSIGQTDASGIQAGGNYSLNAGFWHKNNDLIFKNGFE